VAIGVAGTLLGGWEAFRSLRPPGGLACALFPALLAGGACGAVVWRVPAAAGFSILSAVVAAIVVAAATAGLAAPFASAVGR
jgi:hypothetical protein